MTDRILRWPKVEPLVGISRSSVDRLERADRFPHRVNLTDYTVGWRLSEIQLWVAGERDWPRPTTKADHFVNPSRISA
jgi:predicted DNA-binding transcriptional regulator AlpA